MGHFALTSVTYKCRAGTPEVTTPAPSSALAPFLKDLDLKGGHILGAQVGAAWLCGPRLPLSLRAQPS